MTKIDPSNLENPFSVESNFRLVLYDNGYGMSSYPIIVCLRASKGLMHMLSMKE